VLEVELAAGCSGRGWGKFEAQGVEAFERGKKRHRGILVGDWGESRVYGLATRGFGNASRFKGGGEMTLATVRNVVFLIVAALLLWGLVVESGKKR
jgi:hypothetical protein